MALDLDSEKFQSKEELQSAVQLLNFRSVQWHAAHGACTGILRELRKVLRSEKKSKYRIRSIRRRS